MPGRFTRRNVLALPVASALGGVPALAASYPSRTIRLVVTFSTGGGNDIIARVIAPPLAKILKQSVIVENKPGAGGIIGYQYVARAKPDGYTILVGPLGMVIGEAIYQNLPFDVSKDFAPITEMVSFPFFVVVKGDSPIKTVHDLVAYAKAHPDKANFAAAAPVFWLTSELLAQKTGMKVTRVPYKGSGAMILAVSSGEVLFAIPDAAPVIGQAHSGAIRILATTAPKRVPDFPDVPTLAEAGVPGVDVLGWTGLWAPAHTPPAIIETIYKATRQVLSMPDVKDRMHKLSLVTSGTSPAEFGTEATSQLGLWKKVAKEAHVSLKL